MPTHNDKTTLFFSRYILPVLLLTLAFGAPAKAMADAPAPMSNSDVQRLHELGFSDAAIINRIRSLHTAFDPSSFQKLRDAGLSEAVVVAMAESWARGLKPGGPAATGAGRRPAAPPAAPPAPAPAPPSPNAPAPATKDDDVKKQADVILAAVQSDSGKREQLRSACVAADIVRPQAKPNGNSFDEEELLVWGDTPADQTILARSRKKVLITVKQVNDILYTYQIEDQISRADIDDFTNLGPFVLGGSAPGGAGGGLGLSGGAAAPDDCSPYGKAIELARSSVTDAKTQLSSAIDGLRPAASGEKFKSITLSKTNASWNSTVRPKLDSLEDTIVVLEGLKNPPAGSVPRQCITPDVISNIEQAVKTAKVPACAAVDISNHIEQWPHETYRVISVDPDTNHAVKVTEFYQGAATDGGPLKVNYLASSYALTFSAGALLTKLQNRSYTQVAAVGGSGNVLRVDGRSSLRPAITGLLNYELFSWNKWGIALSAGPALQVNNSSGVSNIGFFAGPSLHLWDRLFLTPGVHVGELADYPPGFSLPGLAVPSGANLDPTKHYTPNFAIAVTFRAKDLGVLKPKAAVSSATSTATQSKPTKTSQEKGKKNQPSSQ